MYPHLSGLLHLPEIPHVRVNRPLVGKMYAQRNNNNDDNDDGGGGDDADDDDERHI